MIAKKEIVARLGAYTGITKLVEAFPNSGSLIILNYHRIGNAAETPYDSGTFSCTTAQFEWQIRYLLQRFRIVNLTEAIMIAHGQLTPERASILLTFDDGYLDNYEQAFPVLRRHDVSASFFLSTAFVGTGSLPWWDIIAYIVKTSSRSVISLPSQKTVVFDLAPFHRERSIRSILRLFKGPTVRDAEQFLCELEAACGSTRPPNNSERCFLNWREAREMEEGGMCFGSHTHTHDILSKLSYSGQLEELRLSREILEHELGHNVDALAYPVGARESFSGETFKALRDAGYTTAFSFYSGINHPGAIEPYDVLRCGVDDESQPLFRLRIALRAATGRCLY